MLELLLLPGTGHQDLKLDRGVVGDTTGWSIQLAAVLTSGPAGTCFQLEVDKSTTVPQG